MTDPIDTSKLGPIKHDPTRPTNLEAEIEAIIVARMGNPGAAARRIVLIPRIRDALFYLSQRESMGVPIAAFPESSDLR